MQSIVSNKRDWIKPELTHLGKIRDVANQQFVGPQGGGTKS